MYAPEQILEFSARKKSGDVSCDVPFDKEEEIDRGGKKYVIKSFTKGGDKPAIIMSTASGDIEFEK